MRKLEEALDDAHNQGKRRGMGQGVLAGFLAGYWWRGRRLKSERRENKKTQAEKDRQISQLERQQYQNRTELAKERAATADTEYQLAASKRQFEQAQVEIQQSAAVPQAERPVMATQPGAPAEVRTAFVPGPQHESKPLTPAAVEQLDPTRVTQPRAETVNLNVDVNAEADLKTDRRVEMNSWHRFEVDARTGKMVEDPSITYGEAFRRERQQETLTKQTAGGGTSQSGTDSSGTGGGYGPVADTPPPTPGYQSPGASGSVTPQPKPTALRRYVASPAAWALALIIILLLVYLIARH
jgi:hypothetical protein